MGITREAHDTSSQERQGGQQSPEQRMHGPLRLLYNHSISTTLLLMFALSLFAQSVTGYRTQPQGGQTGIVSYWQFLVSGDFLETVAENWEGEFLPLAAYVFFTSFLHERGAKESRNPEERGHEKTDRAPSPQSEQGRKDVPWPLKVGGPVRWVYMHSLPLAFLLLFLLAVTVHAVMGLGLYNAILVEHHERPVSVFGYMASSTFWLQSTRNWEAGFFSTAMLAVFSIFLREKGSPVSKPGDQPDKSTGDEGEKGS